MMNAKFYYEKAEQLVKHNKDIEAKGALKKAISLATEENNIPVLIPANRLYAELLLKRDRYTEAGYLFQFIMDKATEVNKEWQGVFTDEIQNAKKQLIEIEKKKVQESVETVKAADAIAEVKETWNKITQNIKEYLSPEDVKKALGLQSDASLTPIISSDRKLVSIGRNAAIFEATVENVIFFEEFALFFVFLCNVREDGAVVRAEQPLNNLYIIDKECKILWNLRANISNKDLCFDIARRDNKTVRIWTFSNIIYDIEVPSLKVSKKKYIKEE